MIQNFVLSRNGRPIPRKYVEFSTADDLDDILKAASIFV
jgi:hypothetical protein